MRYVLIAKFSELTGYSDKAVRRKIEDGVWIQGVHYRRAPDGHIIMDLEGYAKWVEGQRGPLNRSGKASGSNSRGAERAA